jgi:transcriptional regulator with XRE-family HTH domain
MQALKEFMKISDLTQVELAKRIGVHQTMLSHWINGRRSPSAENLKLIWKKTGISLEKLVADL